MSLCHPVTTRPRRVSQLSNVLQCVAVCCSVLQCCSVAVCCSVLQWVVSINLSDASESHILMSQPRHIAKACLCAAYAIGLVASTSAE